MKKISELGLQAIELEDQTVLVDKNQVVKVNDSGHFMCYDFDDPYLVSLKLVTEDDIDHCHQKVIASTKPLEKVPLLVIEDEADRLAYEHCDTVVPKDNTRSLHYSFKKGYNKHAETYKFTEEDLRYAIDYGRNQGYEYASMETFQDSKDLKQLESEQKEDKESFIQSLTKKELWVETYEILTKSEVFRENDNAPYSTTSIKIKNNNQINAIWK